MERSRFVPTNIFAKRLECRVIPLVLVLVTGSSGAFKSVDLRQAWPKNAEPKTCHSNG